MITLAALIIGIGLGAVLSKAPLLAVFPGLLTGGALGYFSVIWYCLKKSFKK